MPQKKNPDVPELIRGKTARVNGNLIALLTLMKAQPLAYNKDNQEDKEPVFDTLDTLKDVLFAVNSMIEHMQPNKQRMYKAASQGYATATDLADYLVRKGVPFRDAHETVGKVVAQAIEEKAGLEDLSVVQLQAVHPAIEDDVLSILTLEGSVASRNHFGGTAPEQVLQAIGRARSRLQEAQPAIAPE